jgi:hypothetical protein
MQEMELLSEVALLRDLPESGARWLVEESAVGAAER